jgi:hypothetical protein
MKKIGLFMTLLFGVLYLTSCLGKGSNKQSATAYGVLAMSSKNYGAYVLNSTLLDLGPLSSPQLSELVGSGKMQLYKCYAFNFEIDFDIPENSSTALQLNGYYTVTINDYYELSTYEASSYPTDTTAVLADEVPVLNGYAASSYAAGYLYLQQIVNQPQDQQIEWEMSYDYSSLTDPAVVGGVRYYDLFVRAVKLTDGTKSSADMPYMNAYYVSNFFSRAAENEKAQLGGSYTSNSTFKFRVFYVKDIKDDVLTWQYVTQEAYIASFLESGSE